MDNKAQIIDLKARDIWLNITIVAEIVAGAVCAMTEIAEAGTDDASWLDALRLKRDQALLRATLTEHEGDTVMVVVENSVNPDYRGFRGPRPSVRETFKDVKMLRKYKGTADPDDTVIQATRKVFVPLMEGGMAETYGMIAKNIDKLIADAGVMMQEMQQMWSTGPGYRTFKELTESNIDALIELFNEARSMAEEVEAKNQQNKGDE